MKLSNQLVILLSLYLSLNSIHTFSISQLNKNNTDSSKVLAPSNTKENNNTNSTNTPAPLSKSQKHHKKHKKHPSSNTQVNNETYVPKNLQNPASCDTSKNMFQLKLSKSLSSKNNSTNIFMPIYSSSSLTTHQPNVHTAFIFIHGAGQTANKYFCDGHGVMKKFPDTISLAPWFGSEQVDGAYWGNGQKTDLSAWWKGGGWKDGANSKNKLLSAFEALDQIVLALTDPTNFPKMKLITITGFSAGGQTLQKYSFFSSLKVHSNSKAKVRVIISNPGSYLYLDKTRPDVSCIPLKDTTKNHNCTLFSVPRNSSCPKYNDYKYGLEKLNEQNKNYYVKDLTPQMVEKLKTELKSKDVRFILGDKDVCNSGNDALYTGYQNEDLCKLSKMKNPPVGKVCKDSAEKVNDVCDTFPDSFNNKFDKKCEGMTQGSNRLQRGRNFLSFCNQKLKFTPKNSIFTGGHDNLALYNDSTFLKWVTDSEA